MFLDVTFPEESTLIGVGIGFGGSNPSRATIFGKDSVRWMPLAQGRGGRKSLTEGYSQKNNSREGNRIHFKPAGPPDGLPDTGSFGRSEN